MFPRTALLFTIVLYLTLFKSTKSQSEDVISINAFADAAFIKVRVLMSLFYFEPIDVFQFSIIDTMDHDDLNYNFTLLRGKLTNVKTLKRYGNVEVTHTGKVYTIADIPLTFKPLKYKANYTMIDFNGKRYSGRLTATISNVTAIFTTKYRNLFRLNLQKFTVKNLGNVDLNFKPSSLAKGAWSNIKTNIRQVIAQRVEESITDYFNNKRSIDDFGLLSETY